MEVEAGVSAPQVKSEVTDSSVAEQEIVRCLQNFPDGMLMSHVAELTAALTAMERQTAINSLLAVKQITISKLGGNLLLKLNSNTQLSGASQEEQAIFSLIEDSNTKGIWIRELRDGSGLSQIQLRRVLKSLETKKLIKTVKAVGTTKKCYMMFNLEPDTSLTGGTFYSDQQLDSELIHTLVTVCTGFIRNRKKCAVESHPEDLMMQKELSYVKLQEILDYIVERKILTVSITVDDLSRILEIAVLDGSVERRADGKLRASAAKLVNSPLVAIPCGICPVVEDCKPNHVISPQNCQYMSDWLSGK